MVVLDSQPEAAMNLIMYLNSLLTLSQANHAARIKKNKVVLYRNRSEYYAALTLDREPQTGRQAARRNVRGKTK